MAKPNWLQRLGDTMLAAQTTSPTSVTGGDAFGPRAMAEFRKGNVKKAQELQQQEDLNAAQAMAIASSVVGIPAGAATVGWVPTLASEGAGWAGSIAAGYLGDKADQKLGTNWIGPVSGIAGGMLSGIGAYRGLVKAGSRGLLKGSGNMYGNRFIDDVATDIMNRNITPLDVPEPVLNVGWAPASKETWVHHSNTSHPEFSPDYKRWDVKNHGAEPKGVYFTKDLGSSMMGDRPYHGLYEIDLKKPIVQVGELNVGDSKNKPRNMLIQWARKMGADGVVFDGISDNKLKNQRILFNMPDTRIVDLENGSWKREFVPNYNSILEWNTKPSLKPGSTVKLLETPSQVRARNADKVISSVPFPRRKDFWTGNHGKEVFVKPTVEIPYWKNRSEFTYHPISVYNRTQDLVGDYYLSNDNPAFMLDIANPNEGVRFGTYEEFSDKVHELVNKNAKTIINYLKPGRVANMRTEDFKRLVIDKTILDLNKYDPTLNVTTYYSDFVDPEEIRYPDNSVKERLIAAKSRISPEMRDNFAEKRKNLRRVRALKKLLLNEDNINSFKIGETVNPLSERLEKIIADNNFEPYRSNLTRHYNDTGSEQEALIQTILDRYRVLRGVNMKNGVPVRTGLSSFYDINAVNGGGRADIPHPLFKRNDLGVLYTSNSLDTAVGYTYPTKPGKKGIGTLGLLREDLDLSGPMEQWIKNNERFEQLPLHDLENIDPNKMYYHLAGSTKHSDYFLNPYSKYVNYVLNRTKGASKLLPNNSLLHNSRILNKILPKLPASAQHGVRHILFFGPKNKSVEGHGLRLLRQEDPMFRKNSTRMHEGLRSDGFTYEFKQGGTLNPFQKELLNNIKSSNANFVKRLNQPNRQTIPDWSDKNKIATHKLSYGNDDNGYFIYPEVQEINGKLVDFTRPPYHKFAGMDSAIKNNDYVRTNSEDVAKWFTENYKNLNIFPKF